MVGRLRETVLRQQILEPGPDNNIMNPNVYQTLCGMRHAFYFHGMSWGQFESVLGLHHDFSLPADGKLKAFPSQTNLTTTHRLPENGVLCWPMWKPYQEPPQGGSGNSQRLLQLRHRALRSAVEKGNVTCSTGRFRWRPLKPGTYHHPRWFLSFRRIGTVF